MCAHIQIQTNKQIGVQSAREAEGRTGRHTSERPEGRAAAVFVSVAGVAS